MFQLVSKYDVINKSKIAFGTQQNHKDGHNKGRGGLVTLFSKTTLNYVIDAIRKLIKEHISAEVRASGMFSVQIDTTQNCTVQDPSPQL